MSFNAFDAGFLAWGGSLAAVAGAAVLVLKASGNQELSAGQFRPEQLATILAGAGAVLIVLRLITESSGMSFGLFLGLAAAAVVTYGAFTSMRDAGLDLPGMDKLGGGDS